MRMLKKAAALLAAALALIPLAGCLSPVSLDAYGYVVSVGIDRGREKKYYYTLALQRALADQNVESGGGAIALACEGNSIFEAINEMEGNVPCSLNFSRVNFIIISREIAESGELEDFVSTSFDSLRIRTSAVVLVSDGAVSEFIGGMYSNNDANIGKLQSALMLDREKTGTVAVMSVSRILEACAGECFDYSTAYGRYDDGIITDTSQKKAESEGENPLGDLEPGARAGGLKSFIDGTAVFSGWRMKGVITREETMLLNMVTGEFGNGVMTLGYDGAGEGGNTPVSVLLTLVSSRVRADGDLSARVTVSLDASVHRKDTAITAKEMDKWLTERLPEILAERMEELFYKLRAMDSDAMRFGTAMVKRFATTAEWEDYDWKKSYSEFVPVFSVTVRNTDKYIGEDMQ